MATWCAACKSHLPQVEYLQQTFASRLSIYGIPMDPIETRDELQAYQARYQPTYQLLIDLSQADRERIADAILNRLGDRALPTSLLLDADNQILAAYRGVPLASEIAAAMAETE